MLPAESRLRNAADFRDTMRQGVRCGRASLVLHARRSSLASSRAGFIVSKAVGNAVTRNRVKRRLRHLTAAELRATPLVVDVVVRALPAAAASADLADDLHSALSTCLDRLAA
ncbi:MAG: ribonuclease P protein component [Propionicimonas sp.]|uniref:ribonuclease P protein component n=1 Tax=Propionicimonas sp. TaxID=1955623 RepID=UPI003D0D6B7E